ncbi:uncharacterized protein LOC118183290 [Stegodyphus dumicola]|uniref:uncharacterized protein LOC118183290 n=1 Tax=Stegodyphus dumicola TaxID=202533 RepID=UPI0015AC03F8|nr:uncharacterized protein LOC118183290 [Stegodyphus dumicola]XP_035208659.1 uncharacterized protein LOC118183290 [Stegodyphus dumicola]
MRSLIFGLMIWITLVQWISVSNASEACNDYVDRILRDLKEDKEYFQDPYEIPEKSFQVGKKLIFINYTGEASIYDGHVFGLSSLHRDGDVIIDRKKKTHLKIYLGAGELKMQCSGKVKLMGHGPNVNVDAKISYVNMKLDIVPTSKGSNPKVANFNIEDIKGFEIKVKGLGPLNFILNPYIRIMTKFFKNLIKLGIESRLKTFLDKKLKEYVIPEECINDTFRRSLGL